MFLQTSMNKIFNDLKVLDLSTVLAGPSVGMFFAELGAKVIKVEHPRNPDVTRSWKLANEDKNAPVSAYFSSINYAKTYLQLDLSQAENKEKLNSMLQDTDILLTNFKRSDYLKFGLEKEQLQDSFPRLIHGRISGYGTDSDRVAYDLILQAESGFMSMNGTPESGPVKMPVALIDVLAAHHLKEGILCKLIERERTGSGGEVSVSLLEAAISSLVNQASNYLMTGQVAKRIGSLHPNIAPYGELFETADKKQITFAIGSELHFEKLCSILNIEVLCSNAKFSNNQSRVIHRAELFSLIQEAIAQRKADDLLSKCHELHIPAGEIKTLDLVFEDEKAKSLIREELIDGVTTKRVSSIAFK